jgi:hypothetical protein
MSLWLKCPGCQANNPLSLRVCPKCGKSLDNLPRESRVYVIGPLETPVPAAPPAHRAKAVFPVAKEAVAAAPVAPKPAKAKKPRQKKS